MTIQQPPTPGWYDRPNGSRQWWDGRSWHGVQAPGTTLVPTALPSAPQPMRMYEQPFAAPHVHVVHQVGTKEVGIAYALLILLGGFGLHRFYLGRVGSAIAFLILWQLGAWTWWTGVGLVFGAAAVLWWIVDLFVLSSMVRDENARRMHAALASSAPQR
ncbi:MAG: TM2 domain-containing protein [Actinomycetota bacterium]